MIENAFIPQSRLRSDSAASCVLSMHRYLCISSSHQQAATTTSLDSEPHRLCARQPEPSLRCCCAAAFEKGLVGLPPKSSSTGTQASPSAATLLICPSSVTTAIEEPPCCPSGPFSFPAFASVTPSGGEATPCGGVDPCCVSWAWRWIVFWRLASLQAKQDTPGLCSCSKYRK